MDQQNIAGQSYDGNPAENYQRFFVPAIGAPVADDLIAIAGLQPGERVLDVACGTGVVARLAAERVSVTGSATGLDTHPGMLAVASSATPLGMAINWQEANAESMPFPDSAFDVVLCQMGLQFVPSKLTALREMRRVLETGGRTVVSVPGPKPALFAIMTDALARHFGREAAAFGDRVFSMHDVDELKELMRSAGFRNVAVEARPKSLRLPAPADVLWQYIFSTPLAKAVAPAGDVKRDAFERDVCAQWQKVRGRRLDATSGRDDDGNCTEVGHPAKRMEGIMGCAFAREQWRISDFGLRAGGHAT